MPSRTSLPIGLILLLAVGLAAGCGKPAPPPNETAPAAVETPADQPKAAPVVEPPAADAMTGEPVDGDWLVGNLSAEMEHLNPFTTTDVYSSRINGLIFETLLDMDNATLELTPELAESWTISDDKMTYTFNMRRDVAFSDGHPLTAQDVVFSLNKVKDPTTDAPHARNYYQDVTACEAIDEYTVRFTCAKPYFRHLFVLGSLDVIPEHIYGEGDFNNHPNNRNPIGSGPYVLESWTTGQELTLVRNEDYWGDKPPTLKRLYKVITNPDAALQVLMRQELDSLGLTAEQWVTRAGKPAFEEKFNKFKYNQNGYTYIGWNIRRPMFADKHVRRALTMLLDRETFLEEIYYGLGQITTGNFFIDEAEYNKAVEPWPFDPEAAMRLLDEADWTDSDGDGIRDKDGVSFQFEVLMIPDNPAAEQIITLFREELGAAGIVMDIRQLEWSSMLQSVQELKFEATLLGWGLPPYPDPYQVWHSSQAVKRGSNHVGFVNVEADKIIEDARLEFDRDKRIALYHRFHEILHEEQPYTFLFCRKSLVAVDKRFQNTLVYPYGMDSLEWWVPKDLQRYP